MMIKCNKEWFWNDFLWRWYIFSLGVHNLRWQFRNSFTNVNKGSRGRPSGGWTVKGHLVNVVCEWPLPLGKNLVEAAIAMWVLCLPTASMILRDLFLRIRTFMISRKNYCELRCEILFQVGLDWGLDLKYFFLFPFHKTLMKKL